MSSVENRTCAPGVRPDVLNYDDIAKMVPALAGHRKFVENVLHLVGIDEVNAIHSRYCYSTGVEFSRHLVEDEFKFKLRIDNEEVLARFPEGAFITVSNHPYGGMDGILLLHLVGKYRKDYQVMVNMFLNNITAMRPTFIAVDPIKTDDPEKKAVTMQGIRRAMAHVKDGHPLGFFPAGAVSKIDRTLHIRDREWQPTITRLIKQLKVRWPPCAGNPDIFPWTQLHFLQHPRSHRLETPQCQAAEGDIQQTQQGGACIHRRTYLR